MPEPPTLIELRRLAERALDGAEGDAQATATWARDAGGDRLTVDVVCILDGHGGQARASAVDDEGLRRAARAAATQARRPRAWPSAGLPDPQEARPHDAYDPEVVRGEPVDGPGAQGLDVSLRRGASRIAIASTKGVAVAEQRSHVIAEVSGARHGRTVRLRAAAPGPSSLDVAALVAEARALLELEGEPADVPDGELALVLGHDAVATVLDHLRPAFGVELDLGSGPLLGRFGSRVAAAAVNLSDSPRYARTLAHGFDAEGLPRRPVPLIQDGVAHRRVHDTASAARAGDGSTSTGHASRAGALAPLPGHLVLVGGGAADVQELCAPVQRGLFVPALSPAREADGDDGFLHTTCGAVLISSGRLAAPVRDTPVRLDPMEILAGVEALTAASRVFPLNANAPTSPGAAIVPALRAQTTFVTNCRN